MGLEKLVVFFILMYLPVQSEADKCSAFFGPSAGYSMRINDSMNYEQGAIVRDFSNEVDNETLIFDNDGCDAVFTLNGSTLLLKKNLLDPSVCGISQVLCQWGCAKFGSPKTGLQVFIDRISRGKFRFKESNYYKNVSEASSIGTMLYSFSHLDLVREDCIDYSQAYIRLSEFTKDFYISHAADGKANLHLNHTLDYDNPPLNYSLKIRAELLNSPHDLNYTTLNIQVTDVDDMDPEFDFDEFYLNITEENNDIVNTSLVTSPPIHATDRDTGDGRQEVYYRFEDGDENTRHCFSIDKISGNISVTCLLDRETKDSYRIVLKAVQQNTVSRSCTATLIVKVLDINDNIPIFNPTEYRTNITEHSSVGTTVVHLRATDLDENPHTRYVILPPYNDTFSSRDNGEVIVQNPSKIDRETGDGTITLLVKALDKKSRKYSISTATVSITLLDVNDKAPVFQMQEYGFPLPPEPTEGHEIGQVSATDDDQVNTPNSEIRYRLQHTMSSNFFSIHNKTGKISIQKKPPTSAGVIELVVLAEDLGSPPLQSSAQILLSRTVVKGNSVNFTVPVNVEEAHTRTENIQSEIGKLVNLKISVDKIEEVLNHKSSCYLIITAKFQNDSVVSGEDLQNKILQHIGEILALFSEQKPQKLAAPQDTFTPVVIALIAICVLMFLGTIILIVYIHNTTKRFKRYKRLHKNLTRQSSLYESQELKIEMPDEQTSDYNGSINGSHSLRNSTTGDLKEGVVSAFTNPAFVTEETEIKLTAAEEEAEQSLNDLTNRLEAEENKVMIVDSYNPSESDIELDPINGYENTPAKFAETTPKDYENVPHTFKSADLPEDYPSNDQNEADSENNTNENMDDDEEPNPDYEVKAVRFSAQVLDTEENKFEPLREKEDKPDLRKDEESGEDLDEEENNEESGDHVNEDLEEDKEDDFGDGIENERTDEEILSPNEVLQDEKSENEEDIPHFSFDTKM